MRYIAAFHRTGFVLLNLFLTWRKGNLRWCCLVPVNHWICFKTVKSSSQSMVLPSTPLRVIRPYKYLGVHLDPTLNFETYFQEIYKKVEGWVNLLHPVLAVIHLVPQNLPIDDYANILRIAAILVLDGHRSESHKRIIRSIETRSLEIIFRNACNPQNCDLRFLTIDNFFKKRMCCFVFDCLNETTCFQFKDYFQRSHQDALNTRKNDKTAKLPSKGQTGFCALQDASTLSLLPLSLRNMNCRALVREALNNYYL